MPTLFVVISPSTILPGQPFSVHWTVCPDSLTDGGLPTPASITLRFDGTEIRIFEAEAGSAGRPAVSGNIPFDRYRVPTGFYLSRTHAIEIVAHLANGTTIRSSGQLRVASPPAPTVVFTSPLRVVMSTFPGDVRAVAWKERYGVNATITNVSPFASMTGIMTLQQAENRVDATGAVTNVLLGGFGPVGSGSATMPSGPIAPGRSAVVAFLPILLQQWAWLREPAGGLPGFWELIAPTVKGFTYRVGPVGLDEFGNSIALGSGIVRVEVRVSQEKRDFQVAAQNLANLALGLAPLLGPFLVLRFLHPEQWWPAFLLEASGAQGRNALDPPEPDPNFQEEVPLEEISFPKELEEEKEFEDLREWLRAAMHFGAVRAAMYTVEARYLGALLAKDNRAQAAQLKRYRLFVQYLRRDCAVIVERATPAAAAITARMSNEKIQSWLMEFANQSLSQEEAASLLALVPAEAADALRAIVKEVAAGPFEIEEMFRLVTESLSASVPNIIETSLQRYDELQPAKQDQAIVGENPPGPQDDNKVQFPRVLRVTAAVIVFTGLILFGAATGVFIPKQGHSLVVELFIPVIAAGVFSLITGFLAGGKTGSLSRGAMGGAANALTNLGLLLVILIAKDPHFVATGGRTLSVWLLVATVLGALLGIIGARARSEMA